MHPAVSPSTTAPEPGTKKPSTQHDACAAAVSYPLLMNRVGRVLHAMASARALSDDEIRQHAADCTRLMEQAYGRFERFHNPHDRDEALLWMHRRDEANRALSPSWRAAREAEIDAAIGVGYFMDQGDRDALAPVKQGGA